MIKDVSAEDINSGRFVFNDVFHVFNYLRKEWTNTAWYYPPHFEVMELGKHDSDENMVVAAPVPFNPLFRGQNAFYEKCYPSRFRRTWTKEEELERLVQMEDFKSILADNPEIQDLVKEGLRVNYDALAQHYGIETNIIDLTNSFGVAAFFATSDYDSSTGQYRPIEETYRQGVIYFLPMGMFTIFDQVFGNNKNCSIWPIGMEALPRPGEQRGFGAYMEEGVDFNTIAPIRFFFRQNKISSLKCHSLNRGSHLFPYDPIVEKVKKMRDDHIYGKDSVKKIVESHPDLMMDEDTAIEILTKRGCTLLDTTPFRYTKAEMDFITERYHNRYPGSFTQNQ